MSAARGQVIFLLSPASLRGRRGSLLLRDGADFPLALRLRATPGVEIGEVFTFVSGLYFRGKLAYARAFGRRRTGPAALVITPSRGLVPVESAIGIPDLREFSDVDIDLGEPRYRLPLTRDASKLVAQLEPGDRVVLLGSIATPKYSEVLLESLGERLLFPGEFVGRGDMSRGGLMLRCVEEGRELSYVPLAGAERRGPRPARLEPRPARERRTPGKRSALSRS